MAIIIKSPREIALMKEAGKVIIGLKAVLFFLENSTTE